MIIEKEYHTALEDFRKSGEMEIISMLRLFEGAGNKHSDSCGDGILSRTNNGNAWVLTDWYLEINKYPKYGDKILAKTWSEQLNSLFTCGRDFQLYCNDEIVVNAVTRWAIMDLTTGRPVKIDQATIDKYQPEAIFSIPDFKLPRIAVPEKWDIEKEIIQRRSDIDFNSHVHNLTYLDYAMDTLPEQLYQERNFKHVHIAYKSGIQVGEKTVCKYACVDGKHIFGIYGNDNVLKTQIELS